MPSLQIFILESNLVLPPFPDCHLFLDILTEYFVSVRKLIIFIISYIILFPLFFFPFFVHKLHLSLVDVVVQSLFATHFTPPLHDHHWKCNVTHIYHPSHDD